MASFSEVSKALGYDPYATTNKICSECSELFESTTKRQLVCSAKCRVSKSRRLKKEGHIPVPVKPFSNRDLQMKRRRIINEYKVQQGCMDCGYNKHPAALDFDHRDPSVKRFNISQDPKRSWKEIEEEVSKCDVVCANCHRIRTDEKQHYHSARMGSDGAPGSTTTN